jgi:hypothetical protein
MHRSAQDRPNSVRGAGTELDSHIHTPAKVKVVKARAQWQRVNP